MCPPFLSSAGAKRTTRHYDVTAVPRKLCLMNWTIKPNNVNISPFYVLVSGIILYRDKIRK